MATDCPGQLMTTGEQAALYADTMDYRDGAWRPGRHYHVALPGQTRLHSLLEQVLNVGSGFLLALLLWRFVITPIWGIETSVVASLQIVALFTVVSVLRGYAWRRWFNGRERAKSLKAALLDDDVKEINIALYSRGGQVPCKPMPKVKPNNEVDG